MLNAFLAWRWSKPLLRGSLVIGALLVFAIVGRTVAAGPAPVARAPPPIASAVASVQPQRGDMLSLSPPSLASAVVHAARATPDDPVFLNTASVADLRRLPGIGEKRAQAILDLRQKLGRFRQIEELLRVKGIGRSTLKKLRPLLRLDPTDGGA